MSACAVAPLDASRCRDFSSLPVALQALVVSSLSPRTLAIASCVSRHLRELASDRPWRELYAELWPLPAAPAATDGGLWKRLYGERQLAVRCWLGRPGCDKQGAHAQAVKACCLLPEPGILFTGSVDRTVRAWDLASGMQLGASRRHGGTVRCLAADAALLASGCSDNSIRVWRCGAGSSTSALPFDLAGERIVLEGHTGPVSSLQLTPELLASGSWDCSVRLWDRRSLQCIAAAHTDDWVHCLSLRGGTLAAACGATVQLFRFDGGSLHRLCSVACPGTASGGTATVAAVECTADGRSAFLGTSDGAVWLADLRPWTEGGAGAGGQPKLALLQWQAAEVAALSWEHPWLAVADRAGGVTMIDAGAATAAGAAAIEGCGGAGKAGKRGSREQRVLPSRVLLSAGMVWSGAAVQCVALGGCWAAAGLDCGTVVTWDGSRGGQQLAAAAAARQHKAERRQRNQERQRAQQQWRSHPVPVPPSQQQQQQQQQPQQQQPASRQSPGGSSLLGRSPSARARVPPPLPPEVLAAAMAAPSCRQQAWQVLRGAHAPPTGDASGTGGAAP